LPFECKAPELGLRDVDVLVDIAQLGRRQRLRPACLAKWTEVAVGHRSGEYLQLA
jgi:hypothetical protein